jgi:hypothetical protein
VLAVIARHVLVPLVLLVTASCGSTPVADAVGECVGTRDQSLVDRTCDDGNEPNGDLAFATTPAKRECGVTTKKATIAGDQDVDVYRTGECDLTRYGVAPSKGLMSWAELQSDANLRVCVFPKCHQGSTHVLGCYETAQGVAIDDDTVPNSSEVRSNSRFVGCCEAGNGRVTAKFECKGYLGYSSDVDTFVWVESNAAGAACATYNVTYGSSSEGCGCSTAIRSPGDSGVVAGVVLLLRRRKRSARNGKAPSSERNSCMIQMFSRAQPSLARL